MDIVDKINSDFDPDDINVILDGAAKEITSLRQQLAEQTSAEPVGWTILNKVTGEPSSYLFTSFNMANGHHKESLQSPNKNIHYGSPLPLYTAPPSVEVLLEAAKAVVERWDTPLWKDVPHTAEYIHRLRDAIATYKPTEG
jgi:hypothetical protein